MADSLKDQLKAWKGDKPDLPKDTSAKRKAEAREQERKARAAAEERARRAQAAEAALTDEELFARAVGEIDDGAEAILQKYEASGEGAAEDDRPSKAAARRGDDEGDAAVAAKVPTGELGERNLFLDAVADARPIAKSDKGSGRKKKR